MPYRAFVAFSGGGAKGIVHVGALKALEAREVEFIGLAGTSAGSIVAALAAAGFTADDLINSDTNGTILDQLREIDPEIARASDIFGRPGWARVKMFRGLLRLGWPFGIYVAVVVVSLGLTWTVTALLMPSAVWGTALGSLMAIGFAIWFAVKTLLDGLARVDRFRDALSCLLQRKMFPGDVDRVVRMSDFGTAGRPSLKIVSANLSRRRLHLFSPDRTPSTAVADAVAASICLPVIFAPWSIDGELHVDGGIVSNLPAWPFDEERELDPEALTIAVEIEDLPEHSALRREDWLQAALRTTLSGSAELNVRVAGPTEQLALPTELDLLDFDVDLASAQAEVRQVAAAAGVRLDKRLFRRPQIYRDACQVTQAIAQDALGVPAGGEAGQPRIRVAVGQLERGYVRSLRLSYSVGFERDGDESMLVPLEGSVAGAAWVDRQSILELYPLAPDRDMPGPAHRLRRKSRPHDLAWVFAIPISAVGEDEPRLLVQIDGNIPLPDDERTAEALSSVDESVKTFFNLIWNELRELED